MALIVKTGNYGYLKGLGIDQGLLDSLKYYKVKVSLSDGKVYFFSWDNSITQACPANKIAVAGCAANFLAKLQAGQTEAEAPGVVTPKQNVTEAKLVAVGSTSLASGSAAAIFLRDATQLHQRVKGSSKDSVYVVVALNSSVKVAAKVKGDKLSVRVESNVPFSQAVLAAFSSVGLNANSGYMSGHFECAKASPQRTLGAVLLGCGLLFDTPLPDYKLVAKLSA